MQWFLGLHNLISYMLFVFPFFKVWENEMFHNVTQLTDILNVGVCERSYNTLYNN